ncbi:putative protein kinase RLK-Pelle-LRR-III family [Medicago truncatula]|uniref:Protein kinase domain-containing protein n=1 Tax=Medicago truncatula TaxID=3880 RepID=A0A396HXI1_MEDTR|nr:putative protein kinase RLK-Pelle-LRR-III family [Medicago truncatula]
MILIEAFNATLNKTFTNASKSDFDTVSTKANIEHGSWLVIYLYSHENIHGNLTSSNVLLDENTNAKITDFGLSSLMTTAANSNVIATAGALGYLEPELSKLKIANIKTDVYSLGVILLELLTRKPLGEACSSA